MPYNPVQLQALKLISKYYHGEPTVIIPYSEAHSLFNHRALDVFENLEGEGVLLVQSYSYDRYVLTVYINTFENLQNGAELSTLSSNIVIINLNITFNQCIHQIESNNQCDQESINLLRAIKDDLELVLNNQKTSVDQGLWSRFKSKVASSDTLKQVLSGYIVQVPLAILSQLCKIE